MLWKIWLRSSWSFTSWGKPETKDEAQVKIVRGNRSWSFGVSSLLFLCQLRVGHSLERDAKHCLILRVLHSLWAVRWFVSYLVLRRKRGWLVVFGWMVAWVPIYLAPTAFISPSVDMDFGRSIGRPRARSQTSEANTPRARETPNRTV